MADGDENAVDRPLGDLVGLDVAQHRRFDLERIFVADHVGRTVFHSTEIFGLR